MVWFSSEGNTQANFGKEVADDLYYKIGKMLLKFTYENNEKDRLIEAARSLGLDISPQINQPDTPRRF